MESMKLLDLHPDYIISNNGAVVYKGRTEARACEHTLSPDVVRRLLEVPLPCVAAESAPAGAAASPVVAANLFSAEGWVATYKVAGLGGSYRPSVQPRIVDDTLESEAYRSHVYVFFFYGPRPYLMPLEEALRRDFANEVTFSFSVPHIIDVTPPNVDKGTATRDMLKLLQLTPDEAAAFGDGMNDLPVLRAVGHGFVMASALPPLLAATTEVDRIGTNDDDGVVKTLEAIFLAAG